MSAPVESARPLDEETYELRQAYLKRLSGHIVEMRRLQELMSLDLLPLGDIQNLYRLTHNYAGSGMTFGFPEISTAARNLHQSLKVFLEAEPEAGRVARERTDVAETLRAFTETCHDAVDRKPQPAAGEAMMPIHSLAAPSADARVIGLLARESQGWEMAQQLRHFGCRVLTADRLAGLAVEPSAPPPDALIVYADPTDAASIAMLLGPDERMPLPPVPLILIAPYDAFASRLAAARLGVQGFFTEPANAFAVLSKIEQVDKCTITSPCHLVLAAESDPLPPICYEALKKAQIAVSVVAPQNLLATLAERTVDLVLVGGTEAEELIAVIRQHDAYLALPVVLLASKETMLAADAPGIDEALALPLDPATLVTTARRRICRAAALRATLVRDSFTGLFNHVSFWERLEAEWLYISRGGSEAALALLDIDRLKEINAACGYATGDQVIKTLARLMQQRLRHSDVIGWCGRSFGIVMPGCSAREAKNILEMLRRGFSEIDYPGGSFELRATFSAGVHRIDAGGTLDQLIDRSRASLCRAKAKGGNHVIAEV